MKLYMIYIGGSCGSSNIEVHDVIFACGESIEETYPQVRDQWFGNPTNLHIDSSLEVNSVDGYAVSLGATQSNQNLKLFFVQTGGYQKGVFGELHGYELLIAENKEDAKLKVKERFYSSLESPHQDSLIEIDNVIPITTVDGYSIILTKTTPKNENKLTSRYTPL